MAVKPKPPGTLRRLLRRAASCASLALAPLLALQLGAAWFLWNGAEISVPDFARDMLRDRLAKNGLACTWSDARISFSGRIALTDARVSVAGSDDAVVEVGRLVTVLDAFDLVFSGKITPRRLWIDRGKLLCPAALSPTGRAEVALADIHADLAMEGGRLVTETLQARCFGIPLVARGRLLPQGMKTTGGAASDHPLRAPGLAAARLVALRPWLATMDGASLELTGEDTPDGVRLALDGLVDAIHLPMAELGRARIRFGAKWDATGPHPEGRATFIVSGLDLHTPPDGAVPEISLKSGRVYVGAEFGRDWELPTSLRLTSHNLEVSGFPADRLQVVFDWSKKPVLNLDAKVLWRDQQANARVTIDADTGESRVDYDAVLTPSGLPDYPAYPKDIPAELALMKITGTVNIAGVVKLDKRAGLETATARIEAGHTQFGSIDMLTFRADVEATPTTLCVTGLDAQSDTQGVAGLFETGFTAESPFRILLRGSAHEEQVSQFGVGAWWGRIWKDLALTPGHPATTDIDVAGQWSGRPDEFIFGKIRARKLSYRKQVFDNAVIRIVEEPSRIAVYDMKVVNDDGTGATGRLEWLHELPSHKVEGIHFDFKGRLTLPVAAELGGDDVVKALADIRLANPADAAVCGYYHGPASATPGREQLEVGVRSAGAFEAWKVPGEDFSGTVLLDGPRIRIKDAKLKYAGGDVLADARILRRPEGMRVTFDTAFDKCDRAEFFAGLAKLKTPKPGDKPAGEKPHAGPVTKTEMSGDFHARLALPDTNTLDGQGHVLLTDPALFKLPVFGVLSRGFEKVGIDFGNYEFRTADSEFFVRKGAAYFPALTLRGPKAVVHVQGNYAMDSDKLFFRATLEPKAGDKIPLLSWALSLPGRSAKLFPVDIRGTLDNPEWSVDPTPSAIFSEKRDDSLGLPPPPEPDDGKW